MSERCTNCGLELFAGQQFCRRCGAAVRPQAAGDERPTRILEGGAGARGGGAGDAHGAGEPRGGGAGTDPFGGPRPTAAQEPFRAFQQTAPLAPSSGRGGRAKWWAFPFIFIVALACIGVLFMRRHAQTPKVVVKRGGLARTGSIVPPLPPVAPELPEDARAAIEHAGIPTPLDEVGATVTGDSTVITKTIRLGEGVTFAIPQAVGDVTVEGWDGDGAEIKVTKRGGSAEQRRVVPVMLSRGDERVSLLSPPASVADKSGVKLSYEIKLPRSLRQLEITADESEVELKKFDGAVSVDVKAGKLVFSELTGQVRGKLIKGDIHVAPPVNARRDSQEFSVVRGNVSVTFGGYPNADVKAETMDGDIEVDSIFPQIKVSKRPGGQHALGRLGDGDSPLLIKVVNGDIKFKN